MCLCHVNVPSPSLIQNLLFTSIMASSTIPLCSHVIPVSCCCFSLQLNLCRPYLYLSSSGLLTRGDFAPREHLAMSGDKFGEGGQCYHHLQVEIRDAAKHPTMHRTSPHTKNYPAQMPMLPRLSNPARARSLDYHSRSFNLLLSPTVEH